MIWKVFDPEGPIVEALFTDLSLQPISAKREAQRTNWVYCGSRGLLREMERHVADHLWNSRSNVGAFSWRRLEISSYRRDVRRLPTLPSRKSAYGAASLPRADDLPLQRMAS